MSNGKDTSQSQGASGGASPPDGANEVESRTIIGAFIAAAGVCVMSWVVIDICGRWPIEGLVLRPWAIVLLLAFAAGAAFAGMNIFRPSVQPAPPKAPPDDPQAAPWNPNRTLIRKPTVKSEDERLAEEAKAKAEAEAKSKAEEKTKAEAALKRRRRVEAFAACGLALAIAAGLFLTIALQAGDRAAFERFALKLDLPARVADQATLPGGQASTGQDPAKAASPAVEATLVWWAPRKSELSNGLLPTFLGGLFICALGVCFSRIGLTAASGGLGLGEKLLAPMVSLGLLGIGATQQIEAAKMEKDAQLAERGLPAVISLSKEVRHERYASELERNQLYVFEREKLSPEGAALLEEKLRALQAQVAHDQADSVRLHGLTTQAMGAIGIELESIRNDLRNPGTRRVGVKLSPDDLDVMRDTVASVEGAIQVRALAAESEQKAQKQAHCRLLRLEQSEMAPAAAALLRRADEKDRVLAEYRERRFWRRWGKPQPESGDEERARAVALQDRLADSVRQHQARCDGGERLAQNDR